MTQKKSQKSKSKSKLVAQKDWHVVQNDINVKIKKGDDLDEHNFPDHILEALKTEKVLKG